MRPFDRRLMLLAAVGLYRAALSFQAHVQTCGGRERPSPHIVDMARQVTDTYANHVVKHYRDFYWASARGSHSEALASALRETDKWAKEGFLN